MSSTPAPRTDAGSPMPWIHDASTVEHAGDLDSYGFAILSLVCSQLPHSRSMLMDRNTLLQHRNRWGRDPKPTRARLDHLHDDELLLYQELVEDVHAPSLRPGLRKVMGQNTLHADLDMVMPCPSRFVHMTPDSLTVHDTGPRTTVVPYGMGTW